MVLNKKNLKPGTTGHMTLSDAPLSTPLRVTGIDSGRQAQTRLASMGIIPGEEVRILQRENGGPLLVEVKSTRVALGRGISAKVIVVSNNESIID